MYARFRSKTYAPADIRTCTPPEISERTHNHQLRNVRTGPEDLKKCRSLKSTALIERPYRPIVSVSQKGKQAK